MRQSIILSNEYETLFIHEATKSGLIELLPSYVDASDDPELKEAQLYYGAQLDKQVEKKKSLLRIILLFDEIILPQAPGSYDYQRLKNGSLFKIIPFEEFYYDNPIQKDGHEQYAQYLKSAILPVAEKRLRSYFRIIPQYVEYPEFISAVYDSVLLKKKLPRKYKEITKINKQEFDMRNKSSLEMAAAMNWPKALTKEGRFFTDVSGVIVTLFEDLCWQLQISSDNDATIMNCEYQLASIGCESFNGKVESSIDAYKILRVECGKAMGTLPEVNSIQEVIHLKEKRHRDIHNLRQELSRLEYEIKNSGSISAIQKAAADISKASKALSAGNAVSQVTRWTTRFLLPLNVASLLTHHPEISIGSGVVTAIGQASTIVGDLISRKNNWLELLI